MSLQLGCIAPQEKKVKKQKANKVNNIIQENAKQLQIRQPFHVILSGTIFNLKRCYGCGKEFKTKYKTEPHDVILKHYCHRRYKDKNGNFVLSTQLQAAYFHLRLDCTRKVDPQMELRDVIIHGEIADALTTQHKDVLRKFGVRL